MKATWRLGRLAGVEVGVHWTVLVIVGLVVTSLGAGVLPDGVGGYSAAEYWIAAVAVGVAFAASVLAHEVSHAVVAGRHGVPVDSIVLWMFGGMAKLQSHARSARAELRIALAGPALSLAVGASCLTVAGALDSVDASALAVAALGWLGAVNVVLAVFNMLPGAPLDGGRVLTAVLWWRWGDEDRARRAASTAGRILGQVLIGLGIAELAFGLATGLWTALVGWLIVSMARMEMLDSTVRTALQGVTVSEVMSTPVVTAPEGLTIEALLHGPWMNARVSTFPLLDVHGHPSGLVTLRRVAAAPRHFWPTTPLASLATPISEMQLVRPEDLLTDVLDEEHDPRARLLVTSDGALVGIVSPTDVARAIQRFELISRAPSHR